jgi:hypothetical protein
MYWFVIYAVRSRTRARVKDPHTGPPETGSWLRCAPPRPAARSIARYTAILAEGEWQVLCEELGLDLEQACREEERCTVCKAGPLPVLFDGRQPLELPGIEPTSLDMRKCVAGPLAAIALELSGPAATSGAATECEIGLCVAPLAKSDAERERVDSLFAAVAFNVGGADAELRCPDCASPELQWLGGSEIAEQMGCGNCGARLARESAFLRLGDCEGILATATRPAMAAAAAVPVGP